MNTPPLNIYHFGYHTQSLIFILLLFFYSLAFAQRQEQLLKQDWRFSKGPISGAEKTAFNDSQWQKVSIPHDWAIYGPFDKEIDKQVVAIVQNGEKNASEKTGRTGALPYVGEGWYRKKSTCQH